MDITTESLKAVELGDQSADWSLDTLTTFSVTNKYAREYVVGAYMHHHPRADVAKVAEACGLTWSLASGKPRCKSLENYRKFYTTVGEIAEANAIPLADALAMLARDRADERSKARKATAARVQELLSQQAPPETEPGESSFPEPEPEPTQVPETVDILTGEEIQIPVPTEPEPENVLVPYELLHEIMLVLDEENRPELANRIAEILAAPVWA